MDIVEEILNIGQDLNNLNYKLVLREADRDTLHHGLIFVTKKLILLADKIMEERKEKK